MSLLQKITHPKSNGSKRLKKAFGVSCKDPKDNNIVEHESRDEDTKCNRRQSDLMNQLIHISNESYSKGVNLLSSKRYEDSRDCFEASLNARLYLYGPEHECLIEVHRQLEHIANIQGDRKKEAYHQHRIHQIYSARKSARILSQKRYTSGAIDWSRI